MHSAASSAFWALGCPACARSYPPSNLDCCPCPLEEVSPSRPYPCLPEPTNQEVLLEGARSQQCLPSCPGPWQRTTHTWGGGPIGPCSSPPVAQPEPTALESTLGSIGAASGPLPLWFSTHARLGRRSGGSCGPLGSLRQLLVLRTLFGASFQPSHPFLFPSLLVPIPMRVVEGTCGTELRPEFVFQLHPFLGYVAWAEDQISLVLHPHVDYEYYSSSLSGFF